MRSGFSGDKYGATCKFKWATYTSPGWLVRWLDPGNWIAVIVEYDNSKAYIYKCVDGYLTCAPIRYSQFATHDCLSLPNAPRTRRSEPRP